MSIFAQHGYEGTSAQMLTEAMGIGRQSIYNSFGDKWQLYLSALRAYGRASVSTQLEALRSHKRAIDGLRSHLESFARDAARSPTCLGLSAISEFGCDRPDVSEISAASYAVLSAAISERVRAAQEDGDVAADVSADEITQFLMSNLSAIKLAARGGASEKALLSMTSITLRALR